MPLTPEQGQGLKGKNDFCALSDVLERQEVSNTGIGKISPSEITGPELKK